jgi:type VI secretion system protein ImpG
MADELLPYYNRELSYIRRLAAQFAEAHPKIAGRLRLGPDASQDPHVERLIEAFAYLNARTRHKLEDEFPEITESLLGVLYPHYQAPVPSLAIVQFDPDPEQFQLTAGYEIPRETELETEPIQGEPCRFRTGYPVTLWPFEVRSAGLSPPPFQAPATAFSARAAAVLRLVLGCRAPELGFDMMELSSLRFFLKGQPQHVYRLYELIFNNTLGVAVAPSATGPDVTVLDKSCLRPVGFGRDEGLLPYPRRSFLGYRLLTERFAFPEKFLFVEVAGLDCPARHRASKQLEIFIYLSQTTPDLEQNVTADTFRLGCTPVVNLYRQTAEPIALSHTDFEYHVVADARRPLAHEVYSVDKVVATSPDNEAMEYVPFYSVKHAAGGRTGPAAFWHSSRRAAETAKGEPDPGTEVYLALVDLAFQPAATAGGTLLVETTCLNRDLPARLPFGGGQPHLRLAAGGELISEITCLTPPTRTLRPALKKGALWGLISHLSLNHLSLVGQTEGADALREILKLYDFADSAETRSMIAGIRSVDSRRTTSRVLTDGASAVCRGVEVTIQFDEDHYTGSGLFLFAAVLERFLALYCSVNSFSKLIATIAGREGALCRWPPRLGEQVLA